MNKAFNIRRYNNDFLKNKPKRYQTENRNMIGTGKKKAALSVQISVNRLFLLVIFTCVLIGFLMIANTKNTYGGIGERSECIGFKSITVTKGDTLYSLAEKHGNFKTFSQDQKDRFVKDTIELNNLDPSGKIYADVYLLIPIYK